MRNGARYSFLYWEAFISEAQPPVQRHFSCTKIPARLPAHPLGLRAPDPVLRLSSSDQSEAALLFFRPSLIPPGPRPESAASVSVFIRRLQMLSRISRFGAHALSRARAGQNLGSSRIHEETIRSYMNHVGKNFFCSTTNAKTSDGTNEPEAKISVAFVDKDGEEKLIKVPVGMSMLEAAHENDIELEGACEGSLACSTCHVIVTDVDYYNKLEDPEDEENDMLDLAFGLTETSRLGCQVIASPELDGIRLVLPTATRNFAVDGHVAKPH